MLADMYGLHHQGYYEDLAQTRPTTPPALSDHALKKLIGDNRNRFLETRQRCFYEDEWTETVLNEEELFKFIKSLLSK